MWKYFFLLFVFISHIAFIPVALALSLDEITYQEARRVKDRVYGVKNGIILSPLNEIIDEEVTLEGDFHALRLSHQKDYREHFGFFKQEENGMQIFIPSWINTEKTLVSAVIQETGVYFFAPIVPEKQALILIRSVPYPKPGEIFVVSSEEIITNAGDVIWDSFPFQIETTNVKINERNIIRTENGKIQFTASTVAPGEAKIRIKTRDFGNDSAVGEMIIKAFDGKMTRAEFVQFVLESFQIPLEPLPESVYAYADVISDEAYAPAVFMAKKLGFIQGRSNDVFRPNAIIKKAEALKIFLLASGKYQEVSHAQKDSPWFMPYFIQAQKLGIISKNLSSDSMRNPLTRAEAVEWVKKFR